MEYLVDGYNVIKSSDLFNANNLEASRNKLIDFIIKYHPQGKNPITVVFDCKSKNPYECDGASKILIKGIKTIFSEGQKTADDVIVEYIENSEKPYNIVIVSNDKGIYRRIGGKGTKKMSVDAFISIKYKNESCRKNTLTESRQIDGDYSEISRELSDLWIKKR
ncbi:MAG: NYN domain-containing protein [Endomicrobiaceae bacterium]